MQELVQGIFGGIVLVGLAIGLAILLIRFRRSFYAGRQAAPDTVEEYGTELVGLNDLSGNTATQCTDRLTNAKEIALRCANQTERAHTYLSEIVVHDRNEKERASAGYVMIRWRLECERPDRYHVTQEGWAEGGTGPFYDEWVTIGHSHCDNFGVWVGNKLPNRIELNHRLDAEKYLVILRTEDPLTGLAYHYMGRVYYCLEYGARSWPLAILDDPVKLLLWIDSGTGYLAKAETRPTGDKTVSWEQTFAGYGAPVHICAPEVQLKLDQH